MIRTPDFFVPNEALYQTEPHPEIDIKLLVGRFFLRKNLRPEGPRYSLPYIVRCIYVALGKNCRENRKQSQRKNIEPCGRYCNDSYEYCNFTGQLFLMHYSN